MVKNPPAMRENWVPSLGWRDPLEVGMATHSGILAKRIPMDRGAWWATIHGVAMGSQTMDKTEWLSTAQPCKYRFSPESTLGLPSWCTHSLQTVLWLTLLWSLLLLSYFPALQLYSHISDPHFQQPSKDLDKESKPIFQTQVVLAKEWLFFCYRKVVGSTYLKHFLFLL